MSNKSITTALVGTGYWGKNLVRNLHGLDGSRLKYVCDTRREALDALRRQYPDVQMVTDLDAVLSDPEVDGVAVVVPAKLHYEIVRRVLEAGKHAFVEKPMTLDLQHSRALVELAERKGRHLMVGHLMQYHPAVEYLRSLIVEGKLGRMYYAYSSRVNLGRIRTDENALWSLAVHDIAMLTYLFGEGPVEVSAQGACYIQNGVEDVSFATLFYADGKVAHVHVSWLDPHKDRRLTLVGSERMAVFDDTHPNEKVRIYDKKVDADASASGYAETITVRDGDISIPYLSAQEPLRRECEHFVSCIRTGKRPRSDGQDGLRVVEVLSAAQRSIVERGVRIRIADL